MRPKSIRWRLPLSYALIALLTTLALGAVLLISLQRYYRQQELDYLTSNAQAISFTLAPLLGDDLPQAALASQLHNFAFLSQSRVRLLDPNGQVVVDSGLPQTQQDVLALALDVDVEIEENVATQIVTQTLTLSGQARNYTPFIIVRKSYLDNAGETAWWATDPLIKGATENNEVFLKKTIAVTSSDVAQLAQLLQQEVDLPALSGVMSPLSTVGTPYGFEFKIGPGSANRRSTQQVRYPFYQPDGRLSGYIALSDGPAYGDQVLVSVAWGWGLAGSVAVLLAAGVGWHISRRLSQPLLVLTEASTRMAGGDLSIRAEVRQQDEVGLLADAFNHMADQVEETVATLRRFVADAAHELHTPLTALQTNLELAVTPAEPEARAFLEKAHQQAKRLETLTNGLLDLSRLEANVAEPNFASVDLTALLQRVSEAYASQAEQAGLTCTFDLLATPVRVWGHEAQLRQVIANLFDNAVKFTPAGGAVTLSLRTLPDQHLVELAVTDTGLGLDPADIPHLFNRFHRGHNAGSYPGNGLGLAIVKASVQQHHGQISVEPLRPGSRFTVKLRSSNVPAL
jgi:signal transduction histidine kinase